MPGVTVLTEADRRELDALVASKGSFQTVAAAVGMPYETLRDWCRGRRAPAAYRVAPIREKIAKLADMRRGRGRPRMVARKTAREQFDP